ncbi:MAG: DPP IV N-terminal domain-containing protein, partial [Candidatus Acidiferrales bacterium]
MNRNLSASPEFYARNTRRRILKLILALCAAAAFLPAAPLQAQISPASDQLLHRMYASPDFEVKYFGPARWMDDGSFYTTVEPSAAVKDARDIVRVETATGKREVLVSASQLIPTNEKSPLDFENFFLSSDKSKLLLYTNTEQVWRRNTRGDYWVLDLRAKTLRKLGGPDAPSSSLMFAKFSPDGAQVAYVRANNIYAENLATGKISQLTTDGSATIINGTSDWVYEEELDVRDAFRWSPDSRRIAYWQFDTSNVGIFKLIYNLGAPKEIVTGFPYPGLGVYPS